MTYSIRNLTGCAGAIVYKFDSVETAEQYFYEKRSHSDGIFSTLLPDLSKDNYKVGDIEYEVLNRKPGSFVMLAFRR